MATTLQISFQLNLVNRDIPILTPISLKFPKIAIINMQSFCSNDDLVTNGDNPSPLSDAYMRQWTGSALVKRMACRLFSAKPLSKPMLGHYQLDH